MYKKILSAALFTLSLNAESCWNSVELSSLAQDEFNDMARFSLKDAVTCKPIAGASVQFLNHTFHSDNKGFISLPLPPENIDAEVPIVITKQGYIDTKERVKVLFGSYWNNLFLMSKELPLESARFVLSWSDKPQDLDIHLKSRAFHISYRKKRSIPNKVALDRDSMHGYGPETITLDKLEKNEKYSVLVYRYSKKGQIDDKTQVRIYTNNKLQKTVRLPNTNARCLEVATIENNRVKYEIQPLADKECK